MLQNAAETIKKRQFASVSFSFNFSSRWHRSTRKDPYALRPVSQQSPQSCPRNSANICLVEHRSFSTFNQLTVTRHSQCEREVLCNVQCHYPGSPNCNVWLTGRTFPAVPQPLQSKPTETYSPPPLLYQLA